jgi:hypothetical protein
MPELMLNSFRLREIADATIGHNWELELAPYVDRLKLKSNIVTEYAAEKGRTELRRREFIRMCFTARRHCDSILSQSTPEEVNRAIDSLLSSDTGPEQSIDCFMSLKGAPPEVLRDLAYEMIHFSYPEKYGLVTRWVWNPLSGTGALRETITAAGIEISFGQLQKVMKSIAASLAVHGYSFRDFLPIDLISALHYSQDVIGAKDNSMNAGGMEALFPNHDVISMMILGIRGIHRANP